MIVVLLLPVSFSGAAAAVIAAAIIPAARAMKVRRQVQIRMIPAVRAQIILSAPTPDFLEIVALQIQAASLNAVRRGEECATSCPRSNFVPCVFYISMFMF